MGRDLLNHPYGRFYYLAKHLSELGHDINMVLYSYRQGENEVKQVDNVTMLSFSVLPLPIRAWSRTRQLAETFNPDWVFGFSDTYFGIFSI